MHYCLKDIITAHIDALLKTPEVFKTALDYGLPVVYATAYLLAGVAAAMIAHGVVSM